MYKSYNKRKHQNHNSELSRPHKQIGVINQLMSSHDPSKTDANGYHWNSQSNVILWEAKRDIFKSKAVAAGVYKLIDPTVMPANVDPNDFDIETVDIETHFLEPEINVIAMVDADEIVERNAMIAHHENSIAAINAVLPINQLLVTREDTKHEERLLKLITNRSAKINQYTNASSQRKTREDKYDQQVARVATLFTDFFDPTYIAQFATDIAMGRIRKTWMKINTRNSGVQGGSGNQRSLSMALNTFVFEISHPIDANIKILEDLATMLRHHGVQTTDSMMKSILIQSIKTSRAHNELKEMAKYCDHSSNTYAETKAVLIGKFSSLILDGQINMNRDDSKQGDVKQHALMSNEIASNIPTCGTCKKRGHTDKDCWYEKPCGVCGKVGHGPWFHKKDKAKAGGKNKANSNAADEFLENVKGK
jgi:hypothetical protein